MSSTSNEEVETITIHEYFKMCADSIDGDTLKKGIERSVTPNTTTDIELKKHNIQACVVTYLDNDVLCINPVSWGRCGWYISDVYEKDGITFKVFVGESD